MTAGGSGASVVVATYEAPRALDLVLAGLARQSRPPDEILVADDGSGAATADVVAAWTERLEAVVHVRHADAGYRKPAIVNEAVLRSTGAHLAFLDGDAIPHRHWLADHLDAARAGTVLCGRRVLLGPRVSARLDRATVASGALERPTGPVTRSVLAGETKRFLLGIRLPRPLARAFHPRPRKLMGVNFSLPRAAFFAVNGYDESHPVPWREDRDLELRLERAGFRFFPLLNRAVVHHLHHPRRAFDPESEAVNEAAERSRAVRAPRGLAERRGGGRAAS